MKGELWDILYSTAGEAAEESDLLRAWLNQVGG